MLGDFLVDLGGLRRQLAHVADAEHLGLGDFGVHAQHRADAEGACLSRTVFALGDEVDVDSLDGLHDQGNCYCLDV